MIKLLRLGAILLLIFGWGAGATAAENDATRQAQAAAKSWLALVDTGQYGQSWDKASLLFRSAVMRSEWERAARAVRTPLGAVQSRTLKSATYTRTLPGAPDGEYVVIEFDSQFANKAAAVETVTPMRDRDGVWRVSGYFVK